MASEGSICPLARNSFEMTHSFGIAFVKQPSGPNFKELLKHKPIHLSKDKYCLAETGYQPKHHVIVLLLLLILSLIFGNETKDPSEANLITESDA